MRKAAIAVLAVAIVFGMSMGVMAGNDAEVEQIGDNHEAIVNQEGDNANASIEQGRKQDDQENEALVEQFHDFGLKQRVDLDQYGSDLEAIINQSGGRSRAGIHQGGSDHFLDVEQIGTSGDNQNLARVWQLESDSYFELFQRGEGNYLGGVNKDNGLEFKVRQAEQEENSTFVGSQIGNDNKIGLYQGGDDFALVTQDGDGNEALLWQGEDAGHTADINQTGDNNETEVIQTSN